MNLSLFKGHHQIWGVDWYGIKSFEICGYWEVTLPSYWVYYNRNANVHLLVVRKYRFLRTESRKNFYQLEA